MRRKSPQNRTTTAPREREAVRNDTSGGPPGSVAVILLAFFLAVVYGPSLKSPFIFDDFPAVKDNKSIVALWPPYGYREPGVLNPPPELPVSGRPLVNLTFALNYLADGYDTVGYHLVNLVLHFCAAMILWAGTRRTLRLPYFAGRFDSVAEWLALAVAMLWGLHPLLTETVIYVTQRTELMMGLFYLATMYCSLRYWDAAPARERSHRDPTAGLTTVGRAKRRNSLALAVVACLCGMASKEVMVSAPLIVFLFERTFIAGSARAALRSSWPLYVGLAATWIPLLLLNLNAPHRDAAGFSFEVSGSDWWLTQSKIVFLYLKLCVWPAPLSIHYQMPYLKTLSDAWEYAVPLALLGIATLILLWKNRPLGFLGAWFAAILSPTFVIPIFSEMAAERRMYLALVIPVVVIVVGGYRLFSLAVGRRETGVQPSVSMSNPMTSIGVPMLVISVVFCFISVRRLADYENELSLWTAVFRDQPNNMRANLYIGWYYEQRGNGDAAIQIYSNYLKREDRLPDLGESQMHYRLGALLVKKGDYQLALPHLAEAVRILPTEVLLRNNYGYALFMAGHTDAAVTEYRSAIQIDPKYWPAYKNLGEALLQAGKHQEALECFQVAHRMLPQNLEVYFGFSNCYVRLNQRSKALAMLQEGHSQAQAAGDTEITQRYTAAIEALK